MVFLLPKYCLIEFCLRWLLDLTIYFLQIRHWHFIQSEKILLLRVHRDGHIDEGLGVHATVLRESVHCRRHPSDNLGLAGAERIMLLVYFDALRLLATDTLLYSFLLCIVRENLNPLEQAYIHGQEILVAPLVLV